MSHDATKNLNDVMRKYDRESNTRAWEGKPKIAVQAYLAAFAIFEVYVTLFGTMLDEVRLTSFVGGLLIAGIGLNMIYDKHIPVGKLLPAIFLPMLYIPLTGLF